MKAAVTGKPYHIRTQTNDLDEDDGFISLNDSLDRLFDQLKSEPVLREEYQTLLKLATQDTEECNYVREMVESLLSSGATDVRQALEVNLQDNILLRNSNPLAAGRYTLLFGPKKIYAISQTQMLSINFPPLKIEYALSSAVDVLINNEGRLVRIFDNARRTYANGCRPVSSREYIKIFQELAYCGADLKKINCDFCTRWEVRYFDDENFSHRIANAAQLFDFFKSGYSIKELSFNHKILSGEEAKRILEEASTTQSKPWLLRYLKERKCHAVTFLDEKNNLSNFLASYKVINDFFESKGLPVKPITPLENVTQTKEKKKSMRPSWKIPEFGLINYQPKSKKLNRTTVFNPYASSSA